MYDFVSPWAAVKGCRLSTPEREEICSCFWPLERYRGANRLKRFAVRDHYLSGGSVMRGQVTSAQNAIYEILIRDADGRHLELESFQDLESARRRLSSIAVQYPGTRITLWNRDTRAIVAETDGY